jgi:hypothetical protein
MNTPLHKAFVIAALCIAAIAPCQSTLAAGPHTTTHRDPKERALFMHQHPCPSTGKAHGACPGYVVDHVTPLACGGADADSTALVRGYRRYAEANADR